MDTKNSVNKDRIRLIKLFGEVESEKTLSELKAAAGNTDDFDKLIIEIASPGGNVSEGLEIMVWLDSLSAMGKIIVTVVVANAYSIASLIMLAANIKLISKHGEVMVHNPMLPELKYVNANDLEKHTLELRALETSMYDLYKMFTGLEAEKIKQLMDNETYLTPQEAVDYGFADMVVDINPRSFEMTTNTKKETNMSKNINSLKKIIAMVNKSDYVNQVYTDTKSGGEIEIFQSDAAVYKKGDKTSLKEGVVVLSDGAKVTIEDYLITEIDRSLEPEEAVFNEGEAPIIEPAESVEEVVEPVVESDPSKVIEKTESTITTKEIQNTEIKELSSWEISVVQDSFEIGTLIEYKPYEDGAEPIAVGAGEYQLEDGRKVLTDSDGIIRFIKPVEEAVAVEEVVEEEVVAKADFEEKLSMLEDKNKELEAKLTEMKESSKEMEAKFAEVNKWQEIAAETIDTVASNMQSKFVPSSKASSKATPSGSIFSQLKAKRGL